MNAFKQQCIELRKQDYTLTEIAKITHRSKSSIYFHIGNLALSSAKREHIKRARAVRAREIAERRRGIGQKKFHIFSTWDVYTVSLVAHFLFDGEITHSGCHYNNRNLSLIRHVERCARKIYDFEPKRYHNALTGVTRISYFNVTFGAYIRERSKELLLGVSLMGAPLQREFVRAFFDDEGCMDFRAQTGVRRIRGYQKNVEVLYIIREVLENLGIQSRIQMPNEIVIAGEMNLRAFQSQINFSKGVKVNGKRTNSTWKKHIEKRVLLDSAIHSYKPVGSNGVHRNQPATIKSRSLSQVTTIETKPRR